MNMIKLSLLGKCGPNSQFTQGNGRKMATNSMLLGSLCHLSLSSSSLSPASTIERSPKTHKLNNRTPFKLYESTNRITIYDAGTVSKDPLGRCCDRSCSCGTNGIILVFYYRVFLRSFLLVFVIFCSVARSVVQFGPYKMNIIHNIRMVWAMGMCKFRFANNDNNN